MNCTVEFEQPYFVKDERILIALGESAAVEHRFLWRLERSGGYSVWRSVLVEPAHFGSNADFQVFKLKILDL